MFDAIQVAYWLALSSWFGGVLFVSVAGPIIYKTVRDADPTLPRVLSVNLEGQHSAVLADMIFSNVLAIVLRVEFICAILLFFAMAAQWFFIDRSWPNLMLPLVRAALYLAALALAIYHGRVVRPRALKYRQEYLDHADEPDIANPALDQFDRYSAESINLLRNVVFLLLGIILFSGNIHSMTALSLQISNP